MQNRLSSYRLQLLIQPQSYLPLPQPPPQFSPSFTPFTPFPSLLTFLHFLSALISQAFYLLYLTLFSGLPYLFTPVMLHILFSPSVLPLCCSHFLLKHWDNACDYLCVHLHSTEQMLQACKIFRFLYLMQCLIYLPSSTRTGGYRRDGMAPTELWSQNHEVSKGLQEETEAIKINKSTKELWQVLTNAWKKHLEQLYKIA